MSDLPIVLTFFTMSAETDLPAAFNSSTSSCWTTLLASAFGGCGTFCGATSPSGSNPLDSSFFVIISSTVGR